jgi:hypothetical protein
VKANRVTFKEIVVAWKNMQPGRSVPIPNKSEPDVRVDAYLNLFETLLGAGYEPEEIKYPQNRSHIIHYSHNPNHRDHKKGKIWKDLAEDDYDSALAKHHLLSPVVEMKTYDKSKANYSAPAAREYQKNIEELKQSIAEHAPPAAVEPEETQEEDSAPIPQDKLITKEWTKVPSVKPVYDPEMRKLLGYDDE